MNTSSLEIVLAQLFSDSDALKNFLADPKLYATKQGLVESDIEALLNSDFVGLEMAAKSYAQKRMQHKRRSIYQRFINLFKA